MTRHNFIAASAGVIGGAVTDLSVRCYGVTWTAVYVGIGAVLFLTLLGLWHSLVLWRKIRYTRLQDKLSVQLRVLQGPFRSAHEVTRTWASSSDRFKENK